MKNILLVSAVTALAMGVSHATEVQRSNDFEISSSILIAQANTAATGAASSNKETGGDKNQKRNVSETDRIFAQLAAGGNAREIQMSEMAAEKATSDEVKQYAKHMIDEHGAANQKLMNAISSTMQQNWVPMKEEDVKRSNVVRDLRKLSGDKFDRQYMATMVKEHSQAVKLYQKQTKSGKTEALKVYAQETLPAIQEHLKTARDLDQKLRGADGKKQ